MESEGRSEKGSRGEKKKFKSERIKRIWGDETHGQSTEEPRCSGRTSAGQTTRLWLLQSSQSLERRQKGLGAPQLHLRQGLHGKATRSRDSSKKHPKIPEIPDLVRSFTYRECQSISNRTLVPTRVKGNNDKKKISKPALKK